MNITSEKEIKIWRKDFEDGKVGYSVSLSKKKENGEYETGFMTCRFKKDTNLQNEQKIKIKSAWLSFYKVEKKTIPYIFINEYELVEEIEELNDIDKNGLPF